MARTDGTALPRIFKDLTKMTAHGWLLMLLSLGQLACDDEKEGGGCADDEACERGQVCVDEVCTVVRCESLGGCRGGQACLDIKQCSVKECADLDRDGVERTCGPERPICLEEGPHRFSCVGELGCSAPGDCARFGLNGFACCRGVCSETCSDMFVLAPADMMAPDGAAPTDAAVDMPDAEINVETPTVGLCAACNRDTDCAEVGEGAKCTPFGSGAFCSSACGGPDDCPAGFQCVAEVGQCLPQTFDCSGCLAEPCSDGQVCDIVTAACVDPLGVCGVCSEDSDCRDGLACGSLGVARHCFEACVDGQCADGLSCEEGLCKPQGACDACGGACGGMTPACNQATGECAQCGDGFPCPEGQNCNQLTFTCEEGGAGCATDLDCMAPRPVCFSGRCVDCLTDSECPPRMACNAQQQCIDSPCTGVVCQQGSQCNPESGRCDPGCAAAADCIEPGMECNGMTGQCYWPDGACDLGGGPGVCPPGSICNPNLLSSRMASCSCAKVTPGDPASADLIPCHPGVSCIDLSVFMLPSICGQIIFAP